MSLENYVNEKEIQEGLDRLFEENKLDAGKIRLYGKDEILKYLKKNIVSNQEVPVKQNKTSDENITSEVVSASSIEPIIEEPIIELPKPIDNNSVFLNYDKYMGDYEEPAESKPVEKHPTSVTYLGGGENNTISNVGGGVELYSNKYGSDLRLRTLSASGYVTNVTQSGDLIIIGSDESVSTVTTDYNLTDGNDIIIVSANSGTNINLKAATGSVKNYKIKSIGTGTITISANGTDTIDNETYQTITQWECINIVDYAAGKWAII
ncbi:MAG: hypothetical protein PHF86_13150 [Candidatus Nanoarchaeia archaeon]|nr:hypothetical protein [Candidatus Nanoarchaeia archaeon]